MADSTTKNPPIDVPAIDLQTGKWVPVWFDRIKWLDVLQPLSQIVFPHDDTKSDVLRSINFQTGTSYTFALTDSGKYCRFNNSSAITVTIPNNSSVAFIPGTQIDVFQAGAGKVTFSPASGVSVSSFQTFKSLAGLYAAGTLIKTDTNTWDLVGSLTA